MNDFSRHFQLLDCSRHFQLFECMPRELQELSHNDKHADQLWLCKSRNMVHFSIFCDELDFRPSSYILQMPVEYAGLDGQLAVADSSGSRSAVIKYLTQVSLIPLEATCSA